MAAQSNTQTAGKGKKAGPVRRVPERTCVACRTARPKRHLVRVVRTTTGDVEVDKTGKQNGRGAYLCPAQECWRMAKARKSLENALGVPVTPESWQRLDAYAQGLPEARL